MTRLQCETYRLPSQRQDHIQYAAACAQSASGVPLREGNIYGHRDHQATSAEEAAAGIAPLSADAKRKVQQGVLRLLQQTDKLDGISDAQTRGGTARFSEQK